MHCMVASSIPCKLSLCADRAHARAGDSYVSSGIDVACPTTQNVLAIASPHELHGDSWPSSSTGTRSFCCNQQYSVTAITTSTGTIAERYAYSTYGQPTILDASASVLSSSAINNRYTYTGREWDATLALHHFRARWMSPSAGRFLSRDPIGYIDGLNLFANYLSLAFTDADGTCCFGCKAKETDLGSKTTSPSSTGGGDVSLTQKDFSHGKCGAFTWVSQFSIKSPVNPSYIMQHLVIEYEISDCEGKNTTKDKKEIWEAWPYDGRGLFANGIDTYSSSGGGACTKGKFSMSGSFYLVNGPIPIPPFKSPHPAVVPITQGPATPTNPNVKTNGAGGDHSITVSWDCCECNSWTDWLPPWAGTELNPEW